MENKESEPNDNNVDGVGEDEEELEPLFNYSRLPAADLLAFDDDRFDCSPIFPDAKRKKSGDGKGVLVLDDEDDDDGNCKGKNKLTTSNVEDKKVLDDDLDWLAPRPKVANQAGIGVKEDKTMKELRLKKQELASFAQSAEVVLQQIEKDAEKQVNDSRKNAPVIVLDEPPKQQPQRPKIVISIMDKAGQKQFRMYMDDKLEKAFKMYADKAQLKLENLVFSFDGDKVSPSSTPIDLDLEDNDVIEVHVKS